MHLLVLAWVYVVLMMALAEAFSSHGTVLGAVVTLLLYGVLPLSILVYILGTPHRKRALRRREAESACTASAGDGNAGGHAAGGTGSAVAPEREEP